MVLNMVDIAQRNKYKIDTSILQSEFPEATIVESNARIKLGKERILEGLKNLRTRGEHLFYKSGNCPIDDLQCQEAESKTGEDRKIDFRSSRKGQNNG